MADDSMNRGNSPKTTICTRILDYAPPDPAKQRKRQRRFQFLLGMAAPYALGAILVGLSSPALGAPYAVLWLLVAGFIVGVVCVHTFTEWKGFLPGVLTGTFVVPVVFALLCTIVGTTMSALYR